MESRSGPSFFFYSGLLLVLFIIQIGLQVGFNSSLAYPFFLVPFLLFLTACIQFRSEFYRQSLRRCSAAPLLLCLYLLVLLFNQDNQGLWGLSAFYKKPRWVLGILVWAWQWSLFPPYGRWMQRLLMSFARIRFRGIWTAWALILFALFLLLRDRAISLDGYEWIETTHNNRWCLYLREVYTILLFRVFYLGLRLGSISAEWTIVVVSAGCGIIFLRMLPVLARLIYPIGVRRRALMVLGICATYGIVQLFFGHIEVYGLLLAGTMIYMILALRYLREENAGFPSVAIAHGVLMGFHVGAIWLLPSCIALPFLKKKRAYSRSPAPALELVRGLVIWIVTGVLLIVPILLYGYKGNPIAFYSRAFQSVTDTPDSRIFLPLAGLFSGAHILDILNLAFLNLPVILILVFYHWILRLHSDTKDITLQFLFVALVSTLFFAFTYRLGRGAMKDWDSFSLTVMIAAVYVSSRIPGNPRGRLCALLYEDLFSIIWLFMLITAFLIVENHFHPFS